MPSLTDWIQAVGSVVAILFSTALSIVFPIYIRHLEIRRYRLEAAAIVSQTFVAAWRMFTNADSELRPSSPRTGRNPPSSYA